MNAFILAVALTGQIGGMPVAIDSGQKDSAGNPIRYTYTYTTPAVYPGFATMPGIPGVIPPNFANYAPGNNTCLVPTGGMAMKGGNGVFLGQLITLPNGASGLPQAATMTQAVKRVYVNRIGRTIGPMVSAR